MGFQFQCPQGHLLEGEESQAGQQCHCPTCGMLFIIPHPVAAPVAQPEPQPAPAPVPEPPEEPQLLHIPCPNGHELEVPPDMIDQDVLCPHCQMQFRLRARDSVEHRRKKQMADERRDYERGQAWLNWAIAIAVIVVIGLIVMIATG